MVSNHNNVSIFWKKKVFLQFSTWAFYGKIGYVKIYILDKNCTFDIVCCCTATATEAHDTALACNTSIEASDSISWHLVEKAFSRAAHSVLMICFQSVLGKHVKLFFSSLFLFPLRRENKEAFSIPAGIRVIRVQKSKNHSFCSVLQIESTNCQGIPLLQPSEATFTFE